MKISKYTVYFSFTGAAVIIQSLSSSSSNPSTLPVIPECEFLFSVSANPPFVIPSAPRHGNSSACVSSSEQTASPVPLLKRTRELGAELREFDYDVPGLPENNEITHQDAGQSFEERVFNTFEGTKRLLEDVVEDPHLLQSTYPELRRAVMDIIQSPQGSRENQMHGIEMYKVLDELKIAVEMLDLNKLMREKGCNDQLIPQNHQELSTKDVKGTRLSNIIDDVEQFGDLLLQCYDENGSPKFDEIDIETKVDFVFSEYKALKERSQLFISQKTPLSRIISEDLETIQVRVLDLITAISVAKHSSPIESSTSEEVSTSPPSENYLSAQENEESSILQRMEKRLRFIGEKYLAAGELLEMDEFQLWRISLHEACDGIFLELLEANLPESPRKRTIEGFLQEATQELRRKTNSVLLFSTELCTSGRHETEKAIQLFAEFFEIIKGDIQYSVSVFEKISAELQRIKFESATLKAEGSLAQVQRQKALFERATSYVNSVEWTILPQAKKVLEARKNAAVAFKEVELFLKQASD